MKKEVKFILFPLIAVALFAIIIFVMNKKEPEVTQALPPEVKMERDGNYSKGKADAKVTIVEFFDPECESCAAFHPILQQVVREHAESVRLVARYMLFHKNSHPAALALEGAGKQGKYWEMYNILLERQPQWSHQEKPVNVFFEAFAKELGLNIEEFNKSYDDLTFKALIAQDMSEGQQLGVKGTPTIFVNGQMLNEPSFQVLKNLVEQKIAH